MLAELISPNLHVVLIHYPLALLIAGVLIELFSFLWRRSSIRMAGRWMILIGALSAIPATFSGIYALRDISRIDIDTDMRWVDMKKASPVFNRPEVWTVLHNHMLYQSIATGIAALVVVIWLGASDRIRKAIYFPLLLMMVFAVSLIVRAAWSGGESVFHNGVGVEPVFPIETTQETDPSTQPATWLNTPTRIEKQFPPLELHIIMAGVFTAIALASIGLSFRKMSGTSLPPEHQPMVTGDPAMAFQSQRQAANTLDLGHTFNPNIAIEGRASAPAGRFWILGFLLALLTLLGGLWVIARGADVFTQMDGHPKQLPRLLWELIKPGKGEWINRHFAHGIAGSAIVVLPILLALLSRFAPRERIILFLTSVLLIAAVAVQVWLGVLLLFDTSDGPVMKFNQPAAADVRP